MKRKFGDIRSNRKLNFENPLYRKWYTEIIVFVSDRRFYGTRDHLSISDWTDHVQSPQNRLVLGPARTVEGKLYLVFSDC